ncbi:hypothetical protein NWI01_35230 [Nitrobacter winogradskyi]|uniref:Uncharacterized protein n=1 Tax=Nitrobacter winogradskyi TaxID=913 RepID=A0A4Y3WHF4_NITWI|nr:hypothetical protein NWI01_35230 [Nitrobacter winogradskyi]
MDNGTGLRTATRDVHISILGDFLAIVTITDQTRGKAHEITVMQAKHLR